GHEEILVARLERGTAGLQNVARDFLHVEERGEEVVLILGPKASRFVPTEARGGGRAQVDQRRHQIRASSRMFVVDIVFLPVNTPIYGMNQTIASPAAGSLQKGSREDTFAAGRKDDLHGVIHPACHDRLEAAAVGTT